jgi:hypothetical protein
MGTTYRLTYAATSRLVGTIDGSAARIPTVAPTTRPPAIASQVWKDAVNEADQIYIHVEQTYIPKNWLRSLVSIATCVAV